MIVKGFIGKQCKSVYKLTPVTAKMPGKKRTDDKWG